MDVNANLSAYTRTDCGYILTPISIIIVLWLVRLWCIFMTCLLMAPRHRLVDAMLTQKLPTVIHTLENWVSLFSVSFYWCKMVHKQRFPCVMIKSFPWIFHHLHNTNIEFAKFVEDYRLPNTTHLYSLWTCYLFRGVTPHVTLQGSNCSHYAK